MMTVIMRAIIWLTMSVVGAKYLFGQDCTLAAKVDGREFFEGEPVYLQFLLQNNGSDTVWIFKPFSLGGALSGAMTDNTNQRLPERHFFVDYFVGPGYRGVPITPGETAYEVVIAQEWWGNPGEESAFDQHLGTGTYRFQLRLPVISGCGRAEWHDLSGWLPEV